MAPEEFRRRTSELELFWLRLDEQVSLYVQIGFDPGRFVWFSCTEMSSAQFGSVQLSSVQ